MDFDLSEPQRIILHSAKTFLEKEVKGLAREVETTYEGYAPEKWKKMAQLGWLGVVLPEEYGGIDGTFLDLVLLLEEAGRALFPGPLIPSIISGLCVHRYGRDSQKKEILPGLIQGEIIVSPATFKPGEGLGEKPVPDEVKNVNGRFTISGTRLYVPFGHVAHRILYSAETDRGTACFLIPSDSAGLHVIALDSIGCDKPCEVNLEEVMVSEACIVGSVGSGEEMIEHIHMWGALAESAYLTGMLEQVLAMSVAHAKERVQFGRKIGSFQAIQHQCADMARDIDQVKFLTYQAASRLSEGLPAQKEISMAKAFASDASRRVSLLGVKILGGMGVSQEHDMQLYFRRAKSAEIAYGDADFHREIVARQLGL
jgi:alkylation response protein AidB-like acyl-CoA dehydrogenase